MPANNVLKLQKFYQTTKKPIWYAHPKSKYYLVPYFVGLTVSLSASLFFAFRAGFGIKATKN